MHRAAVSALSNLAEGKGRYTRRELTQFLITARGSLLELETQIVIAQALGYLGKEKTDMLTSRSSEVGRLLNGMLKPFNQPHPKEHPQPET